MKGLRMQTNRAYPKPERSDNPSPLEMAIYNFELKAKAYHDQKLVNSSKNDKDILDKMKQDFEHLQKEKKRLLSLYSMQESLSAYRKQNEDTTEDELAKEEHHPTTKLAKFLTAVGEPKPTRNHEAHHIICGKARHRQRLMAFARLSLHEHGIGINDPINGVWLCNTEKNKMEDWATPESVSHRRIHRYNYETWIGQAFASPENKSQFIGKLRTMKLRIKMGSMPDNVMKPKDINWTGK